MQLRILTLKTWNWKTQKQIYSFLLAISFCLLIADKWFQGPEVQEKNYGNDLYKQMSIIWF